MSNEQKTKKQIVWENLQYGVLGMTIIGQVITNVPLSCLYG